VSGTNFPVKVPLFPVAGEKFPVAAACRLDCRWDWGSRAE